MSVVQVPQLGHDGERIDITPFADRAQVLLFDDKGFEFAQS